MNKGKTILLSIFAIALTIIVLIFTQTSNVYYGAKNVYRVYVNGKTIGLIESKKELENYIDKEQQEIKKKYNVDKVYIPNGLEIKEEITYNENIEKASAIYEKIKDKNDFTIDGYIITITSTAQTNNESEEEAKKIKKNIYVLDKKVFQDAVNSTVISFVDEDSYNAYLEENQKEIEDIGVIIENVYIDEEIMIRKDHIPANEKIYLKDGELAQFLLFGNHKNEKTYKVKTGDTVSSIAEKNKLNVNELLVANQNLSGENALLYQGQELIVDLIDPQITIVEETHKVAYQTLKFKTETEKDSSLYVGQSVVARQGKNGKSKLTTKVQTANGQIRNVVTISEEIITPATNKLVKVGEKTSYVVGGGNWYWPTKSGYTLTDGYEWRWGKLHAAQDIAGLGCNSPIFSAQAGTVVVSEYQSSLGNYVKINHNNGYTTLYAHLSKRYVSVGQAVQAGQVIGTMGNTGFSFGCHLHFVATYNGQTFDPMKLYR